MVPTLSNFDFLPYTRNLSEFSKSVYTVYRCIRIQVFPKGSISNCIRKEGIHLYTMDTSVTTYLPDLRMCFYN
jgi:hypothetical protein